MDGEAAQQMRELVNWVRETIAWGLAAGNFGARATAMHLEGRIEDANRMLAEKANSEIKTIMGSVAGNRPGAFIDVGRGALIDLSEPRQRAQLVAATLRRALELAETVD